MKPTKKVRIFGNFFFFEWEKTNWLTWIQLLDLSKENKNHKFHRCCELKQLVIVRTWSTVLYILTKLSENRLLAHINMINEKVFNAIKLNVMLYNSIVLLHFWITIDRRENPSIYLQ